MAEYAYYRRTRIVRVNDLIASRMNMLNPEYPCIHCSTPVMDHVKIELDYCQLRTEADCCTICAATTRRTCFICKDSLVCDNCWPKHIRKHYVRVRTIKHPKHS